jgi:hypothetical protein
MFLRSPNIGSLMCVVRSKVQASPENMQRCSKLLCPPLSVSSRRFWERTRLRSKQTPGESNRSLRQAQRSRFLRLSLRLNSSASSISRHHVPFLLQIPTTNTPGVSTVFPMWHPSFTSMVHFGSSVAAIVRSGSPVPRTIRSSKVNSSGRGIQPMPIQKPRRTSGRIDSSLKSTQISVTRLSAISPTAAREIRTQIQVKPGYLARNVLSVLLGITMVLVSRSQPTSMQSVAHLKSTLLRDRVAAPDPKKYSTVSDARDWQNPYLILRAKWNRRPDNNTATEVPAMSPSEADSRQTDWQTRNNQVELMIAPRVGLPFAACGCEIYSQGAAH